MKNLFIGNICLIICLVITGCKSKIEQKTEALKIGTEIIKSSNITNETQYVGTVEEATSTAVSFTGSGNIKKIVVDEGQHVYKGQLIAELDKTQAQNILSSAQAQLKQAEDSYTRLKQLHDSNSLAEIKWVEIQTKLEEARSQVELAKKNLSNCMITAPVSGIIGKKYMNAGETALPSQPICNILNIKTVKINVSIPEKEIGKILPHTPTTIFVESLNQTFTGGIIEKNIQADKLTRTYNIKININNNNEQILPGMVCNVDIKFDSFEREQQNIITIPIRSIQRSSNGNLFVWIVQGTKAHRQGITVGRTIGNRVRIMEGLNNNDTLIVSGYQKVSEGMEVKL